jgi:hypothetical protein
MEQNMNISVIVFQNGYREASLHGAILVVRPDGSHYLL